MNTRTVGFSVLYSVRAVIEGHVTDSSLSRRREGVTESVVLESSAGRIRKTDLIRASQSQWKR
jgi:hypothetical protein